MAMASLRALCARRTGLLAGVFAALSLAGCGGGEPGGGGAPETSGLSAEARALVRDENCDPRTAEAVAAADAHWLFCTYPTLTAECGAENYERGLALIPQAQEDGLGQLNPWLQACAGGADDRTLMVLGCRLGGVFPDNASKCECAADAHLDEAFESEVIATYALLSINNAREAIARHPDYMGILSGRPVSQMDDDHQRRWERVEAARSAFFNAFQTCAG